MALQSGQLCTMKQKEKVLPITELDTAVEEMLPELPEYSHFFFIILIITTLFLSVISVIVLK